MPNSTTNFWLRFGGIGGLAFRVEGFEGLVV